MTDQNTPEKTLDELKVRFSKDRSNRNKARDNLRDALDTHREKKRISGYLREEKARLGNKRVNIWSIIHDLDNRISEAYKKLDGDIGEQGKLQAEIEVRELEQKRERSQADLKESDSLLNQLDEKIKEAEKEVVEAEKRIKKAREDLSNKQTAVQAAASNVIKKAAAQQLVEKIAGTGARIFDKLGIPGTLSVGYIFAVIIGLGGDLIYYRNNGVNIFHYAQPEDFFLSGYKLFIVPVAAIVVLLLVLAVVKLILELLAGYGFPVFKETTALILPGLIRWSATPSALALTVFIIFPVATSYAFATTQQWQSAASDVVSVVLEDPFKTADKLNWIGSNSRYAFFRPVMGQNGQATEVLVIPFDRIACIRDGETATGDKCRRSKASMEVEFKQNEEIRDMFDRLIETLARNNRIPTVTESELYSYIEETMKCATDQLVTSGLILFGNDKSELRAQAFYEIDSFLKVKGTSSETTVFGFASPDGLRGENEKLAEERACKVAQMICAVINQDYRYFENQAESTDKCGCSDVGIVADKGEDHFINGVANSRSALIAACG